MEIKSSNVSASSDANQPITKKNQNQSDIKFADELKNIDKAECPDVKDEKKADTETKETLEQKKAEENSNTEQVNENIVSTNEVKIGKNKTLTEIVKEILPESENEKNKEFTEMIQNVPLESEIDDTQNADVRPIQKPEDDKNRNVNNAINSLANVLSKLNQPEDDNKKPDITAIEHKSKGLHLDENIFNNKEKDNKKGVDVINNDYNIDNKDKLPQMMPNMNFGSDGQPFSSFMNNENARNQDRKPEATAKNLAEEAAILSTMAENIAMANKVNAEMTSAESNEKIVMKEDGIKKIDTETNIVKEVIVKHDAIIMNEADVEVFANLVDGKDVNINNLTQDALQKSVHVSKTLADMLAKAMEDNKPIRIEFDNGISIIIKISKDGKLSADFLPSTQIAETYLKENLPILKQRFDDQNLDYEELNRRERRNPDKEQNKKKGRNDE